jgi:hypothetical protein
MTDKKIASALLTILLAAMPQAALAQVCTPAQECGDVNAEDGVTIADALGVLRRSIELPVELQCSCNGGDECPVGGAQETGQTQCWDPIDVSAPINPIDCIGTGQDGEMRPGVSNQFENNNNGTITDKRTTLQWEVLTDNGDPLHDWDDFSYLWAGAFGKVQDLNEISFAGHNDWRVPTIKELQTLVNFSAYNPAAFQPFSSECMAGCDSTECSCTKAANYWTSTSYQNSPQLAWAVQMQTGVVTSASKTSYNYVRAVRGGY